MLAKLGVVATDGSPRRRDAERTKTRILDAARQRFAELGFEGTTIRGVAADADIDPAMVMRYFTDKSTLFNAAVREDPKIPDLASVPDGQLGQAIASAFLGRWREPGPVTILRAAATNQATANQVHAAYRDQIAAVAARVSPPGEAQERAALVASQIVGLAVSRYILRLEPLPDIDVDTLARRIAPVLQHYLTGPLDDAGQV